MPEAAAASPSLFQSPLFPLIMMIPVFYFLILRPKNKEMKRTQEMLAAVKKGDKVMTTGGIFAEVQSVDKETILVKMGDANRVELSKSAILRVIAD